MKLFALLAVVVVVLAFPSVARAAEPVWPDAILALEKAALREPQPGTAWTQLCDFALENGLMTELRQRWEGRVQDGGGGEESILLGWLDLEAGDSASGRASFERATAVIPKSHYAWQALAEVQLRAGDVAGEASARKALELATSDPERLRARRLPALIAQERGELAKAWTIWKAIESKVLTPSVRLALIPDFCRAHLAIGDAREWIAALTAASASARADDAACLAAGLLALGDPAQAHEIAAKALIANDRHPGLRRLVAEAAQAAGFSGEAATRVESALGDTPDDAQLFHALTVFADLDAPDHLLRTCRRHATRLAPMAARWRTLLPQYWKMGVTAELREIFAGQAAAGNWELPLALAEMAILENDDTAAVEPLWHLMSAQFDRDELASTVGAEGNAPTAREHAIALRGYSLARRISSIEAQIADANILGPIQRSSLSKRPIDSLVEARDLALVYLHKLAFLSKEKPAKDFLPRLRAQVAHWPLGERSIAYVATACPEGLIDSAAEIAAQNPAAEPLARASRRQLQRLRLIPNLNGKLSDRLSKLLARPLKPVGASPVGRYRRRPEDVLRKPYRLFESGKFAEADQAFIQALEDFSVSGLGPTIAQWVQFHGSTFVTLKDFPEGKERARAASYALRWFALQTPRRSDWPSAHHPQALWKRNENLTSLPRLFVPTRGDGPFIYGAGNIRQTAPLGGVFPADLWPACLVLAINLASENDPAALSRERIGLGPESERLLTMAGTLPAVLRGQAPSLVHLKPLLDSPDRNTAKLLVLLAEVGALEDREHGGFHDDDLVSAVIASREPDRTAWLVACLHFLGLRTPAAQMEPMVEALLPLRLDNTSYEDVRETLSRWSSAADRTAEDRALGRAWLGKLAIAHLRTPSEALLSDAKVHLKALIDAAEVDQAVAVAQRVLSWAPARVERNDSMISIQKQALRALHTCGESNRWLAELQARAKSGGAADWLRLVIQSGFILELQAEPGEASDDDRFATVLRRSASNARSEAIASLVQSEPENPKHWVRFREITISYRPEDRPEALQIGLETMLRASEAGIDVELVAAGLQEDFDRLAELLKRWRVTSVRRPGADYLPRVPGILMALNLWNAGKKEAATVWLRKLYETNGVEVAERDELRALFVEALAAHGDHPGMVKAFALALRQYTEPAAEFGVSFRADAMGFVVRRVPPLHPLMEQIRELKLDEAILAEVSKETDPQSLMVARLLRLIQRDPTVLPELAEWVDKNPPMQILEFLAERLAPWKEGHELARKVLGLLEPAHAWPSKDDRIKQLSHYAGLAARCGLTAEASQWWDACLGAQRKSSWRSLGVHFDLFEVVAPENRANLIKELQARMKTVEWSDDEFMKGVQRLMRRAHRKPAGELLKAFSSARKDAMSPTHARCAENWLMNIEAGEGRWGQQTPVAWLHGVREDGSSEVGWSFAWSQGSGEEKTLFAPSESNLAPGEKMRLEIFFGKRPDRMERLMRFDEAGPGGMVVGPFDFSNGFIAVALGVGEGVILGPQQPLHFGENLIVPSPTQLEKMPTAIWSRSAPPNEISIRSVNLRSSQDRGTLSPATAQVVLAPHKGKDFVVSGWIKGGHIDFGFVRADGSRKVTQFKLIETDPLVWTRIERTYTAESLAATEEMGKDAQYALFIAPGSEYRGLRVIAVEPIKEERGGR